MRNKTWANVFHWETGEYLGIFECHKGATTKFEDCVMVNITFTFADKLVCIHVPSTNLFRSRKAALKAMATLNRTEAAEHARLLLEARWREQEFSFYARQEGLGKEWESQQKLIDKWRPLLYVLAPSPKNMQKRLTLATLLENEEKHMKARKAQEAGDAAQNP